MGETPEGDIMPVAYVKRALVQGGMDHEGARQAPKGFNGSWDIRYDSKTGAPMRLFTIEERSIDDAGKTKVTGYFNCVAKGDLMAQIDALQWSEVEIVAELRHNRDTKYLQFEVVKVSKVEA
jgi:hypothetical protein